MDVWACLSTFSYYTENAKLQEGKRAERLFNFLADPDRSLCCHTPTATVYSFLGSQAKCSFALHITQAPTTPATPTQTLGFTHQQARTLLFARRAKKTSVPFLHRRCRGWVGGSPLSLGPTAVKHYARKARLPRFTHQQARTLLFARRAKKPLFPFCTDGAPRPLPDGPSTELGLSVTKRDTTRTQGSANWKPQGAQALGKPLTGVMSAAAIRAAVFADTFRDVQR